MKFKTETRMTMVAHTINGQTHQVPETRTERVPAVPKDWDTIATRAAAGIVLALTLVAGTWSTVSIGTMLGGGVGYAAAVVFDASWLTVLILEWLARFDPIKRSFPRRAGWVLVLIAAGAIFWHGLAQSVALAVVGAAVSVVSKALWLAVFKHIDRPISTADAAWLAAEESRLSALEATTTVRVRAAQAEERATLRLLHAERLRATVSGQGVSVSGQGAPAPMMVAVTSADTVRTPAEPVSIAQLAREQVSAGVPDSEAVSAILSGRPDTTPDTVLRSIRRERRRVEQAGGSGYL